MGLATRIRRRAKIIGLGKSYLDNNAYATKIFNQRDEAQSYTGGIAKSGDGGVRWQLENSPDEVSARLLRQFEERGSKRKASARRSARRCESVGFGRRPVTAPDTSYSAELPLRMPDSKGR